VSQNSPAMAGRPEKGDLGNFEQLPKELRQEIAETALATSTTVDEAIKAIQDSSMIYGGVQLNDRAAKNLLIKSIPNNFDQAIKQVKHLEGTELKDFTKLAHILANKFNISTGRIADQFGTPLADKYEDLLAQAITINLADDNGMIKLIKDGLDVNLTLKNNNSLLMRMAEFEWSSKFTQLLLDAGANPYHKNDRGQIALDIARSEKIRQLLEEAMNNPPSH